MKLKSMTKNIGTGKPFHAIIPRETRMKVLKVLMLRIEKTGEVQTMKEIYLDALYRKLNLQREVKRKSKPSTLSYLINDIPASTRESFKETAKTQGVSMTEFLITATEELCNQELLQQQS